MGQLRTSSLLFAGRLLASCILLAVDDPLSILGRAASVAASEGLVDAVTPALSTETDWLYDLSLTLMAVATLCAVGTSLYLYRWRRILLANPHMLVPEELGKWLNSLGDSVRGMGGTLSVVAEAQSAESKKLTRQSSDVGEKVSNLIETFMTLQTALNERDNEISRLKRGYDAEVFRKFIARFLRVSQALDDIQAIPQPKAENIGQLRRLFDDAFAECGVEQFIPNIGSDYRTEFGVADNPKTTKAADPADVFKIVSVVEVGYRVRGLEADELIVPAKVTIYRD